MIHLTFIVSSPAAFTFLYFFLYIFRPTTHHDLSLSHFSHWSCPPAVDVSFVCIHFSFRLPVLIHDVAVHTSFSLRTLILLSLSSSAAKVLDHWVHTPIADPISLYYSYSLTCLSVSTTSWEQSTFLILSLSQHNGCPTVPAHMCLMNEWILYPPQLSAFWQ